MEARGRHLLYFLFPPPPQRVVVLRDDLSGGGGALKDALLFRRGRGKGGRTTNAASWRKIREGGRGKKKNGLTGGGRQKKGGEITMRGKLGFGFPFGAESFFFISGAKRGKKECSVSPHTQFPKLGEKVFYAPSDRYSKNFPFY